MTERIATIDDASEKKDNLGAIGKTRQVRRTCAKMRHPRKDAARTIGPSDD